MNLVLSSISLNAARVKQREQSRYFHEQARQLACDPEHAHRAFDPVTNSWVVTQPPCVADPMESSQEFVARTISEHDPKTIVTQKPPKQSGAPVNYTLGDIDAMSPEDRAIALAQVCAVDGARERIRNAGCATLRQALEQELTYQRALIRENKRISRQARESRFSKSAAKRDNSKGYRRLKQGGTARMMPNRRGETFYVNVVAPMVDGYSWTRKLGRHEKLVITQNLEKSDV